jgi:hypothetical protein
VKLVEEITARLGDRVLFVSHESDDTDGILIVTGCATACVDRVPFAGTRIWTISAPGDAERFIEEIKEQVEDKDALEGPVQE